MSKMKYDKETLKLIKKVEDVDEEVLLSWSGYTSKVDYEIKTEEKFNREELIDQNFEDIEYGYQNYL